MFSSRTACRLFLQTAKTILMNYSCLAVYTDTDTHINRLPYNSLAHAHRGIITILQYTQVYIICTCKKVNSTLIKQLTNQVRTCEATQQVCYQ